MIMAAGKGTRLLPLTGNRPKALVEHKGIPLLRYVLEKLYHYNFRDIIINVHHFPDMIRDYLRVNKNFGMNISISDEAQALLETGGGLKKASWFFDSGPFLVYNVDVQTGLNLEYLYNYHIKHSSIATLAVKKRKTTRPLLMNVEKYLCGWKNELTGEEIISRFENNLIPVGFSGIYILDPVIFSMINETGSFSIIPVLLRLSGEHKINLYMHNDKWNEMGRIENFR